MPDSEPDSPALQFLRSAGIPFSIFVHAGPVNSLEQAAEERGQTPDQVVRSILFRLSENEYFMALMPGPRQISWKALRNALSTNRLTLANDQELKQITGYEKGAVNPFGLPHSVRVLIDTRLITLDTISLGSGIRGTALIMKSDDLIASLPDYQIINLSTDE